MNIENVPHIAYSDFLINQEEPDVEDRDNYVEFWKRHVGYARSGVIVGGFYFSPFLYWHVNFFKISIDEEDEYGFERPVIKRPFLRDNEILLDWVDQQSKAHGNKPVIGFGTRRFAKTAIQASRFAHSIFCYENSFYVLAGGSKPDINNITKYFDDFYANRPSCFADLMKLGGWERTSSDVEFGFFRDKVKKAKDAEGKTIPINPYSYEMFPGILENPKNDRFIYSRVAIRNLEHGQVQSKNEILAGITPTDISWDEVGKYLYGKQRKAVKPALVTVSGKVRCVEYLFGTGGDIDAAQDAEKDFLFADKAGFFVFDPNKFREYVKPEYFQYEQESDKKTGVFVPAQMSMQAGEKQEIPLTEYLNREFTSQQKKDLEGLNVFVTRWEEAREKIEKHIEEEYNDSTLAGKKAEMYYPFQPESCFLYTKHNPFPIEAARKAQEIISATKGFGEFVELDEDVNGRVVVYESKKDIVREYPFSGGEADAPVVIYERPIMENPLAIPEGTYVAGFDGTKQAVSLTTDSLNTLVIYKRMAGVSGTRFVQVASIAARPNRQEDLYRQVVLLLRMYNAEVLPEKDRPFCKYLQDTNNEKYLASAKGTYLRLNETGKADTSVGLPPTTENQSHMLNLIRDYCWEKLYTGEEGEDGAPKYELGVSRIPDYYLLEELIKFGNYKNYDRIIAFGHALIWDQELKIKGILGFEGELRQQEVRQHTQKAQRNSGRNKKYRPRRLLR
jgi:hypothetical protein